MRAQASDRLARTVGKRIDRHRGCELLHPTPGGRQRPVRSRCCLHRHPPVRAAERRRSNFGRRFLARVIRRQMLPRRCTSPLYFTLASLTASSPVTTPQPVEGESMFLSAVAAKSWAELCLALCITGHSLPVRSTEMKCSDCPGLERGKGDIFRQNTWNQKGWEVASQS